jgi:hypothetical protein
VHGVPPKPPTGEGSELSRAVGILPFPFDDLLERLVLTLELDDPTGLDLVDGRQGVAGRFAVAAQSINRNRCEKL